MHHLRNLINKEVLKKRLEQDDTSRITLSFYRYVKIENPEELRNELYKQWSDLQVMGRIYLAQEGINAQLSVPHCNFKDFQKNLYSHKIFKDVPFKIAVEDNGKSFYKLTIKVKEKIVADGLNDKTFDASNTGTHLTAKEFNLLMEEQEGIVVDMRNHYESEVGHFEKAICPDADTFREELQLVQELLKGEEDKKILLYCTGGIRCEKASAYLKHKGFKNTYQLKGGIIQYAHDVKAQGIKSKFKGKNFVFDERVGERITEDIISKCHQCDEACDQHTNCQNNACHLLFIQCSDCNSNFAGCCSDRCQKITKLPLDEQRKLRKGNCDPDSLKVYKSRLRPRLNEVYK